MGLWIVGLRGMNRQLWESEPHQKGWNLPPTEVSTCGAGGCSADKALKGFSRPNNDVAGAGGAVEASSSADDGSAFSSVSELPAQTCSPIIEIGTWQPHDEHFTVGMKLSEAILAFFGLKPLHLTG